MFIELLAAILIGCVLGTVTGLLPGLHINLVASIILGVLPALSALFPIYMIVTAIVAMSFTHVFMDFIPTIFLGAASENTAFASLPGNELLLDGFGLDAVRLAVSGAFLGLILIALLTPVLLFFVPFIFRIFEPFLGYILLFFGASLVFMERSKAWALLVFILSGFVGFFALNIEGLNEPLLPMLSGLFGISLLIINVNKNVLLPKQYFIQVIDKKPTDFFKPLMLGSFSGGLVSIFPALGPAHSAAISTQVFNSRDKQAYLILVGCISSVAMFMSLITAFSIGKARNGSIAVGQGLIGGLRFSDFELLVVVAIISGAIALILSLIIARIFSRLIGRFDYRTTCIILIFLVSSLVFVFSGIFGLVVLVASAALGLVPIFVGVNRTSLMGCLMLPVALYYF